MAKDAEIEGIQLVCYCRGAPTCALNRRAPSTDVRPQPTCALNRRAPSTDVRPQPTCALNRR
ncbi:MAG: hypothetical protein F6K41_04460, partial [Symploca sp. SIO3E6]|nr:hypothetical protein [Caldora sp. SIO3E6]